MSCDEVHLVFFCWLESVLLASLMELCYRFGIKVLFYCILFVCHISPLLLHPCMLWIFCITDILIFWHFWSYVTDYGISVWACWAYFLTKMCACFGFFAIRDGRWRRGRGCVTTLVFSVDDKDAVRINTCWTYVFNRNAFMLWIFFQRDKWWGRGCVMTLASPADD